MFWTEIKAHKYRALKTFALYVGFGTIGLCTALRGPTLLDLEIATNSTTDKVAYSIPSGSGGSMLGSIFCGIIIEYVDNQILAIIALLANAVFWSAVPFQRTIPSLCINVGLAGACTGFMKTVANVWLLHLWGKQAPPFMQALHFFYGLGSLIAPLIAAPFLLPVQHPLHVPMNGTNATDVVIIRRPYTAEDLKIEYPFVIGGICSVVSAIFLFIVYICKRDNKPHPSRKVSLHKDDETALPAVKKFLIVGATAVFMFLYFGTEICVGTLLATYVVKCDLELDKITASYMTAVFWGTFTFFRCITILVVHKVGSTNLIIFDLFLIMLGNGILYPFGHKYEWALWAGSALMGLGMSSMFAAVLGFLDEFIVVTSKITSTIMVSASFGVAVLPFIVGLYLDTYPEAFLLLCMCSGTACCILFALLLICRHSMAKSKQISK